MNIVYMQTEPSLGMNKRDLYLTYFWNINEKGQICLVTFDAIQEEYPEEQDIIRMRMPLGGFLITPHKYSINKC